MSTIIYPAPIFGPVTSRRLGRSLGVNLLPADGKVCSFDCVYCECGLNVERRPREDMPTRPRIASALRERLLCMKTAGEQLDAITFSGNGEPTSHPDFEGIVDDVIALRGEFFPAAKVCLLTNSTHLGKDSVFRAVQKIDKACLKLDTVNPDYIRLVDRPQTRYDLAKLIERMKQLSGRCVIQTMFMKGTVDGVSVDNTGDEYVLPWLETVREIAPSAVDIYTISRETPLKTLQKASTEELDRIVQLVRAAGIDAHAFG